MCIWMGQELLMQLLLKKSFKEIVVDTGVDILSFGYKNGAIMARSYCCV